MRLGEIYGINHSKEEYEKAHMLSEKFSYDDCEGCYLIIPSFKNLEITQKHYPEIYEEYVKKNSSNIPWLMVESIVSYLYEK